MRKILFLSLPITFPLFSALPPLAESVREIHAIVSDPTLYHLLDSSESIQQIAKIEGGFAVLTNSHLLRVSVQYLPSEKMGPVPFRLEFGQPIDLMGRVND